MPFSIIQGFIFFSFFLLNKPNFVEFSFYASITTICGVALSLRCEYWTCQKQDIGAFFLLLLGLAILFDIIIFICSGHLFFGILLFANATQSIANKAYYASKGGKLPYIVCALSLIPFLVYQSISAAALGCGLPIMLYIALGKVVEIPKEDLLQNIKGTITNNFVRKNDIRHNWVASIGAIANQNWLPIQGFLFLGTQHLASFLFIWRATNFAPMFLSKPLSWQLYHKAGGENFKRDFFKIFVGGVFLSLAILEFVRSWLVSDTEFFSLLLGVLVAAAVTARFSSNLLTHALAFANKLSWAMGFQLCFLCLLGLNTILVRDEIQNYVVFLSLQLGFGILTTLLFYHLYSPSKNYDH